jgi:integrase
MGCGELSGHVQQVDRRRWRLVINLPPTTVNGRRHYPKTQRVVLAAGKREALRLLDKWRAALERQRSADGTVVTIAELARRFLAAKQREVRPMTIEWYEQTLARSILPGIGERAIACLGPDDLSALYADLADAGLGQGSIRHAHVCLSSLLTWAVKRGLLERSPMVLLEHPPSSQRAERSVWSDDQVATAVAASRGLHIHIPLVLAAWTGLRRGEVCALHWKSVDLEEGVLLVEATLEQTRAGLSLHEPKTASGRRLVPLPEAALEELRAHRLAQDAFRLAKRGEWNPESFVVCRLSGEPLKPDSLSCAWHWFVTSRGYAPLSFHDLRHSYASGIFEQGGSDRERMLKVVQNLLGHADPAITARIYLHASAAVTRSVVDRQQERIAAAMTRVEQEPPEAHGDVVSLSEARRKRKQLSE